MEREFASLQRGKNDAWLVMAQITAVDKNVNYDQASGGEFDGSQGEREGLEHFIKCFMQ